MESQIQEAIAGGRFSGLPGEGLPLPVDPLETLAGSDWLGFHVLRQGEMLPDWLDLARDIERDEQRLAAIRERFIETSRLSGDLDAWAEDAGRLKLIVDEFVAHGRRLRKKQDRFNLMAPGAATQRPGIWVDQKRRQLCEFMRECDAPEWAVESVCA